MKKLNLIKKTGCCSDVNINEDDIAMDFINDMEVLAVSDTSTVSISFIKSISISSSLMSIVEQQHPVFLIKFNFFMIYVFFIRQIYI